MTYRIAIVGAGFCGTVLSAHLLRKTTTPLDLTLIERGPAIGRGVAYAARDWPYLLNVPAGRMSADSAAPLQFLEYAQRHSPGVQLDHYLPREIYGDYLQDLLRHAEQTTLPSASLRRLDGEVTEIVRPGGSGVFRLAMAGRAPVEADCVVLALGTPPSRELPWMSEIATHPAYHPNPWTLPRRTDADRTIMILGNGLSMADAVLSLCDEPALIPHIVSISRRGLLPLSQSPDPATVVDSSDTAPVVRAVTARQLLSASRQLARAHAARGGDWRDVITAIRHLIPPLWQRLPHAERRRFVRHLQSYWDVHRHRLPPSMGARLDELRSTGRLQVNAGHVIAARPEGDRLRVVWRSRGRGQVESRLVDAVVNALGPDYSVRRSKQPLLRSLLQSGLIREDALQIGLHTGPHGGCVSVSGATTDGLYYLGPLLRAQYWEATAASELRDHAEQMARHLITVASGARASSA